MRTRGRGELAGPQVAPCDLDVAIVGQLPAAHLPFGGEFEAGPIEIVGFETTLGGRALVEKTLEHASWHSHYAFILANTDAEFDSGDIDIPASIRGKSEEHAGPPRFLGVPVMFS